MPLRLPVPARGALALLLLAAGCSRDPVAPLLPPELAILSLAPYVDGRIVAREDGPVLRLLVRARHRDALVREAVVTVPAGARLLWPDGRPASADDLRVGRGVIVWAAGPVLESLPPQVEAGRMLVHGRALFGRAAAP